MATQSHHEVSEQKSTDPDEIRREIEATRAELAGDVDRLADRTSPKRVARRGLDKIGSKVSSVKDTVMGTADSAGSSAKSTAHQAGHAAADTAQQAGHAVKGAAQEAGSVVRDKATGAADSVKGAASSAADTVRAAPGQVKAKTQGNPLAVGLIAFGAGLLAATLIPATDAERQAGQKLADKGSDLVDQVREPVMGAVSQVKDEVTESAKQSAEEVKGTAQQAAQATKQQAKDSTLQAKDDVQRTASNGSSTY